MKIGILGATGAVGEQMRECLEERNIEVNELRLMASPKSAGKKLKFKNEDIEVIAINDDAFRGLDVVLGAAENDIAKMYADQIVKSGAVFIDNSSAFRMNDDVPLVIPEINGLDVKKHKGIISNPNCSTIITLMAVAPINKLSEIEFMIASTYQAVSGAGVGGMVELREQMKKLAVDENAKLEHNTFKHEIAYNLIPAIGSKTDNLYTTEEMKMQNEGRKIMHLPNLKVTCTCVRVPVMRSHCISATVVTKDKLDIEAVRKSIENFEGVRLTDDIDNNIYPMPLNTKNQDLVEVGRIRKDLVFENGIALFCSGDQIRKGAASNAVDIIKYL